MAETDFSLTEGKGILTLNGDWPSARAEELKAVLLDGLARTDDLVLSLEGVSGVSLPFYQILCAAFISARRQHKRLSLQGPFPRPVAQGAWIAGILPRETERGAAAGCLGKARPEESP